MKLGDMQENVEERSDVEDSVVPYSYLSPEDRALFERLNFPTWIDDVVGP